MKTLMLLCFLAAVVSSETNPPTVQDLTAHLASAKTAFLNAVQTDPDSAVPQAVQHLGGALSIANYLIMNGDLTLPEAANKIVQLLIPFMNAASHVPQIAQFSNLVCQTGQLPFPDEFSVAYPELTGAMNTMVQGICARIAASAAAPPAVDSPPAPPAVDSPPAPPAVEIPEKA